MEQAYAQALYTAIERGTKPAEAIRALQARLTREGRAALASRIARAFERIARMQAGKHRVRLSVARREDVARAREAAAKHADVSAQGIEIDPALIGGWRLEHGDSLVDASYKKHLLDLYNRVIA